MRVDQLLKKLCLIKTRNIAKTACDKNLVKINNKTAKASTIVKENDVIEFEIYGFKNIVKIKTIPIGNVSKTKAPAFYSLIERIKLDI
jgi:ribosomal 50S subunit-recycling heat shock protein